MSISSKELSRGRIEKVVNKWIQGSGSDFAEQDTATNSILPFLESLARAPGFLQKLSRKKKLKTGTLICGIKLIMTYREQEF